MTVNFYKNWENSVNYGEIGRNYGIGPCLQEGGDSYFEDVSFDLDAKVCFILGIGRLDPVLAPMVPHCTLS